MSEILRGEMFACAVLRRSSYTEANNLKCSNATLGRSTIGHATRCMAGQEEELTERRGSKSMIAVLYLLETR
eukprot:17280-Amphidinium_carterae.1